MRATGVATLVTALSSPSGGDAAPRPEPTTAPSAATQAAPPMPTAFLRRALETRIGGGALSLELTSEGIAVGPGTSIETLERLAGVLPAGFEIDVSIDDEHGGTLAAIGSAPSLARIRLGSRTRLRLERRFYYTVATDSDKQWLLGQSLPGAAAPFDRILIRRIAMDTRAASASDMELTTSGIGPAKPPAAPSPASTPDTPAPAPKPPIRRDGPTVATLAPIGLLASTLPPVAPAASGESPATRRPDTRPESPWLSELAAAIRPAIPGSISAGAAPPAPSREPGRLEIASPGPAPATMRAAEATMPSRASPRPPAAASVIGTATPPAALLVGVAGLVAWRRRHPRPAIEAEEATAPELSRAVHELIQARASRGQDIEHLRPVHDAVRALDAGPRRAVEIANRTRMHLLAELDAVVDQMRRRGGATYLDRIETVLVNQRRLAFAES